MYHAQDREGSRIVSVGDQVRPDRPESITAVLDIRSHVTGTWRFGQQICCEAEPPDQSIRGLWVLLGDIVPSLDQILFRLLRKNDTSHEAVFFRPWR